LCLWSLLTDHPFDEVLKPRFWRFVFPGKSGMNTNDLIECIAGAHSSKRTHARLVVVRAVAGDGIAVKVLGMPETFEVSDMSWWETLGITPKATEPEILAAYRERSKIAHPDKGGSEDDMAALNRAKEEALRTAKALRAVAAA